MCQWCNRVSECITDLNESKDAGKIHGTEVIELKEGIGS